MLGNLQDTNMKNNSTTLILALLLLFLGVSPISEPHIVGKVQWLMGGAVGMKFIDWFDLFLHGGSLLISVVLLLRILIRTIRKQ